MITSIQIENFKGIGERVRIDLRPITLVFGGNSAGKSSILHALHYAQEIIERHNLDAGHTRSGGAQFDLGGFRSFVHNHDLGRAVGLRLDFDFEHLHPGTYLAGEGLSPERQHAWLDLLQGAETGWVELAVRWDAARLQPYVARYSVGLNGQPLGGIEADAGRRSVPIAVLDADHPLLRGRTGEVSYAVAPLLQGLSFAEPIPIPGQPDALPYRGRLLDLGQDGRPAPRPGPAGGGAAGALLSLLFVAPMERLRYDLGRYRFLGSLCALPSRHYAPRPPDDEACWANGLAAWEELRQGDDELIRRVSGWLKDRLDTGYSVRRKQVALLPRDGPLWLALTSGKGYDGAADLAAGLEKLPFQTSLVLIDEARQLEVSPHDIGVGVAQVLPIVVGALDDEGGLFAVDEPELHGHPRLQAELGDLLVEAALAGPPNHPRKQLLFETHSQQLVLRLLRRVRETGEGRPYKEQAVRPCDLAIWHVDQSQKQTTVRQMEVDDRGEFLGPWPDKLFEQDFLERFA